MSERKDDSVAAAVGRDTEYSTVPSSIGDVSSVMSLYLHCHTKMSKMFGKAKDI